MLKTDTIITSIHKDSLPGKSHNVIIRLHHWIEWCATYPLLIVRLRRCYHKHHLMHIPSQSLTVGKTVRVSEKEIVLDDKAITFMTRYINNHI